MRVVKFSSSESCPLYGTMFNIALFTGWLAPGNSSLAPPRPCEIPMSLLSFSSTLIIINSMLICHHHLCHLHNHHHPHDHHRSHHDMVKVSFAWWPLAGWWTMQNKYTKYAKYIQYVESLANLHIMSYHQGQPGDCWLGCGEHGGL